MITHLSKCICTSILFLAFIQFATAPTLVAAKNNPKSADLRKNVQADDNKEKFAVSETIRIVGELVKDSFPELRNASIKVKFFHSRSDYFRSRFSLTRFLTFRKLDYLILVNPRIFEQNAPSETAVRGIVAHELAHIVYYKRRNRFKLFGLIGLLSDSFTVRFERGADLEAIRRGYGNELKEYRRWLYQNIPPKNVAAKKRDYFSPEEIDLIMTATAEKTALFDFWRKNIPLNKAQINAVSAGK